MPGRPVRRLALQGDILSGVNQVGAIMAKQQPAVGGGNGLGENETVELLISFGPRIFSIVCVCVCVRVRKLAVYLYYCWKTNADLGPFLGMQEMFLIISPKLFTETLIETLVIKNLIVW